MNRIRRIPSLCGGFSARDPLRAGFFFTATGDAGSVIAGHVVLPSSLGAGLHDGASFSVI